MANREQLRRLKAGVEGWNAWRQENPDAQIDLRGAKLTGLALQNVDLSGADIRGTNFSEADLTGANFTRAKAGIQKRLSILLNLSPLLVIFVFVLLHYISTKSGTASRFISTRAPNDFFWPGVALLALMPPISLYVLPEPIGFVLGATISAAIFTMLRFLDASLGIHPSHYFDESITALSPFFIYLIAWFAFEGDENFSILHSLLVGFSSTGGTQFEEAILTDADFFEAQLKNTNFRDATFTRTRLHRAKQLEFTRCGGTILDKAAIRKLAVTHKGSNKSYVGQNLKGINLQSADLSGANLLEANISDATLEGASLEGANLAKVQALRTRFQQATLTAACIEAWNIDSTTQLEGVICDHIYLLNNQQERRPNSGCFAPGEFTKLFQEVLDTIDLIFRDGVDWKAFVATFHDIQVQNDDINLVIQSIENKGDGVVVVKVKASEDADKAKIHAEFSATYELKLQALEAQYRAQLEAKDSEITSYRRENANMMEITRLLAKKSINVNTNNNQGASIGNFANQVNDNASQNYSSESTSTEIDPALTTILFLAANPISTTRLRLDEELREIDESLRRSQQRDQFNLINRGAVRSRDFYRAILDSQPKIVHFSGHGTDQDGLALEDDQGNATFMGAEQLAALFEMFAEEGVECVLLNACYSKAQAQAIRQHIPHVIGMSQTITDKAGIEFAVAFYDSLGAGKDVNFAFKLAKSQLITLGEHKIPELL